MSFGAHSFICLVYHIAQDVKVLERNRRDRSLGFRWTGGTQEGTGVFVAPFWSYFIGLASLVRGFSSDSHLGSTGLS